MAKKPGKRVVMNREALDAIRLGVADGMQAVGELIIERTDPTVPDAAPYGQGLIASGKAATYVDGRKVAGEGSAPRGTTNEGTHTTVVGYGFPGRFQELGTVHHAAQPFFTPGMASQVEGAGPVLADHIRARLAKVRNNATSA